MARKVETAHGEAKAEAECHHHWIIESPKGPSSRGVCKYCGAEKEFVNYWQDFFWEDDVSAVREIAGVQDINSDYDE